jgi:O-antigen ligase
MRAHLVLFRHPPNTTIQETRKPTTMISPSGQRIGIRRPISVAAHAERPMQRDRLLASVGFALLAAFVFTMPLENSIIIPGFGTVGRVVGLVAFVVGIMAVVESGKVRSLTLPHLAMLAFVIWVSLTYFWTIDPDETVEELLSYVQLLAMVWLIWQTAPKREQQTRLMQAYIAGAAILSVATILRNQSSVVGLRQGAFNMNPNDIGLRIVLSVPMALYLSTIDKSAIRAWLYRAQTVVVVCALFFTASRGAFVAFLASLLMIPLTFRAWSARQKVATAVLVVVAVMAALKVVPKAAWERLGSTGTEITQGTMDARTVIWHAGMEVYLEHPFLGVGAGSFPASVQRKTATAWAPHNTFLSVLVEQGAVGFSIFAVLLMALFYTAMKMRGRERSLWLVMLLTWGLGASVMNWEYYKPTWFVFAMIVTQSAAFAAIPVRNRLIRTNRPFRGQPGRVPKQVREFWNTTFEQPEAGVQKRGFRPMRGPR